MGSESRAMAATLGCVQYTSSLPLFRIVWHPVVWRYAAPAVLSWRVFVRQRFASAPSCRPVEPQYSQILLSASTEGKRELTGLTVKAFFRITRADDDSPLRALLTFFPSSLLAFCFRRVA